MTDNTLYHALVLNLHQPASNLEHLLAHNEPEARDILLAMERIPRTLRNEQEFGRVHLSLSGTLLETLNDPDFQNQASGIVDCGALLDQLGSQQAIELLGTGYYHPVLPLVPPCRLGSAPGTLATVRPPLVPTPWDRGLLAAGNGVLHGDDPPAAALWLYLRAGG